MEEIMIMDSFQFFNNEVKSFLSKKMAVTQADRRAVTDKRKAKSFLQDLAVILNMNKIPTDDND